MKQDKTLGRREFTVASAIAVLSGVAITVSGCGGSGQRFFEYDSANDEMNGKINLERITYVTPRLKVGSNEARLTRKNIDALVAALRKGDYTSFRVKAYILFDEHPVTLYESELFESRANPVSRKDLKAISKGLGDALKVYQSI